MTDDSSDCIEVSIHIYGNEVVRRYARQCQKAVYAISRDQSVADQNARLKEIFFSPHEDGYHYGSASNFLTPYFQLQPGPLQIYLLARQEIPTKFQDLLTLFLATMCKTAVVKLEYHTPDEITGFRLTTKTETSIYSVSDQYEFLYPMADGRNREDIYDLEQTMIDCLCDENKGRAKHLRKYHPHLDLDWDSYNNA